jgi:hypothetical protein
MSGEMDLSDRIKVYQTLHEELSRDPNYTSVRFNPATGVLAAIHKDHHFDPTVGRFGMPRGDYERITLDILYNAGHTVLLVSELMERNIRTTDGLLNGKPFDIKGVEGSGKRHIEYKIRESGKQGAEVLVLFYPDSSLFSKPEIENAFEDYLRNSKSKRVQQVYYIVDNLLFKL